MECFIFIPVFREHSTDSDKKAERSASPQDRNNSDEERTDQSPRPRSSRPRRSRSPNFDLHRSRSGHGSRHGSRSGGRSANERKNESFDRRQKAEERSFSAFKAKFCCLFILLRLSLVKNK